MIRGAANGDRFHFVFASDAAEIRPEARLQLVRYESQSFLRAENTCMRLRTYECGMWESPDQSSASRTSV